ncbi:hypothetical protein EW146_g4562 [Bondarzewia mesenterica]|uniref:Uncharacterized protein n=1 Tax=Bondarzewia mesenterica TaxID=1095465 RepID=A0A4S4LZY2_9AGAM|nr:hypothetical protein EW146_g4562 [Bondarzewia mesenterica]
MSIFRHVILLLPQSSLYMTECVLSLQVAKVSNSQSSLHVDGSSPCPATLISTTLTVAATATALAILAFDIIMNLNKINCDSADQLARTHFQLSHIYKTKGSDAKFLHSYAEWVLEHFSMKDANSAKSPLPPGLKLVHATAEPTLKDNALMAKIPYWEALGFIMYLMVGTHPNLACAVQRLSSFMAQNNLINASNLDTDSASDDDVKHGLSKDEDNVDGDIDSDDSKDDKKWDTTKRKKLSKKPA